MAKRHPQMSYSMADHAETLLAVPTAEWTDHQKWLINHFQTQMNLAFEYALNMASVKAGLTIEQRAVLVECFEKNLV
jgi:hypothetical protein